MKISKIKVMAAEKTVNKNRIYIFIKKETILENLVERRSRPYNEYKKEILPKLIEKGYLKKESKVKWSQTAGCSCGCSPGFIVEGEFGSEIFVDIE